MIPSAAFQPVYFAMQALTITRPDDLHLHLRDGAAMRSVVKHTAARFARAIVMPNLTPPVVNVEQALAYRGRILAALDRGHAFRPLMVLYLTEHTPPAEVEKAAASEFVHAFKYYPTGATTHSDWGVRDINRAGKTLEAMMKHGLPLLVHGEVTDPAVDIFDREAVFIERVLAPLTRKFPELKIVFEHVSTRAAVDFVLAAAGPVAATITPQHILLNRNDLFSGGLRPHHYCRPVLKAEADRRAVLAAAISGNPKFFLGTDSAPHARGAKESACGAAGIFSAHAALEFYLEAFEQAGALDKFEAFSSHYGADFYGLARNRGSITLVRQAQSIPALLPLGEAELTPFRAGGECAWRIDGAGRS